MKRLNVLQRLPLGRRFIVVLLPVMFLAIAAVAVFTRQVIRGQFDREARAGLAMQLDARALPMTSRLHAMVRELEVLAAQSGEQGLARSSDGPGEAWNRQANGVLQRWVELDELFIVQSLGDLHRLSRVRRGDVQTSVLREQELPVWSRISHQDGNLQLVEGRRLAQPAMRAFDDGERLQVTMVQAIGGVNAWVGARLRDGSLDPHLLSLRHDPKSEVMLLDLSGQRLDDGGGAARPSYFGKQQLGELAGFEVSGTGIFDIYAESGHSPWVCAVHRDAELGIVAVYGVPRSTLTAAVSAMRSRGLLILLLASLISAILIHSLTRRVGIPLERLTRTMETVARGDLSQRLPVGGDDEIARLSRSFNTMISDLHTTHVALRNQSQRLADALTEIEDVEAMKDSFLALVSHEVRTPLTSIMGGVEFLRDEYRDRHDETEREFMGIVYDSARRLAGFMNDAIMMASLQANRTKGGFETFSLTGLLQTKLEALDDFRAAQGTSLENRMEAQREFFVMGDWTLMQVALEKILHNAYRHNIEGGRVVIELVERILEDSDGSIERQMAARGIEPDDSTMVWRALRIFNTGPTIPEEKVEGLFERFELTHDISNHQRGSGLSLPITGYVLGYHGGCIEVRAVSETGMAFYIVLPGHLADTPRTTEHVVSEGIDETVAAARLIHMAEEEVARLELGIEEAERLQQEKDETGALEEVLVGDDTRVEAADPEPSGNGVPRR